MTPREWRLTQATKCCLPTSWWGLCNAPLGQAFIFFPIFISSNFCESFASIWLARHLSCNKPHRHCLRCQQVLAGTQKGRTGLPNLLDFALVALLSLALTPDRPSIFSFSCGQSCHVTAFPNSHTSARGRKEKTAQSVGLAIGSVRVVGKSGRSGLELSDNTQMRGEMYRL